MAETIYPYHPGSHGIDFHSLRTERVRLQPENPIMGGSGKALDCLYEPAHVLITDAANPEYILEAEACNGFAIFEVTTHVGRVIQHRHPDLFARQFVRYMLLDHFPTYGIEIHTVLDQWYPYSVNYKKYNEGLKRKQSRVSAALQTWSGHTYPILGYGVLLEEEIVPRKNRQSVDYIEVPFHRG